MARCSTFRWRPGRWSGRRSGRRLPEGRPDGWPDPIDFFSWVLFNFYYAPPSNHNFICFVHLSHYPVNKQVITTFLTPFSQGHRLVMPFSQAASEKRISEEDPATPPRSKRYNTQPSPTRPAEAADITDPENYTLDQLQAPPPSYKAT